MTSVPHSGAKSVTPGGSVAGGGQMDAASLHDRRPGELRGEEASEIEARHRAVEGPGMASLARERFGLPDDWKVMIWQVEGDYPNSWGQTVEGGVCPPKLTGKHKGSPNWSKATMKRKLTVSDAELEAHIAAWEARTGLHAPCKGTGMRWIGWGVETGARYAPCKKCEGLGVNPAIAKATAGETRNAEPIHRRDGDEG